MTYLPMLFTPVLILCIWIVVDELCKMTYATIHVFAGTRRLSSCVTRGM